jgi:uncharacterized protein DUF6507
LPGTVEGSAAVAGWDIEPLGVRGVVSRTQDVAGQFEDELSAIGSALADGAENSSSPIVAAAVAGFAAAVQDDIRFAVARTGATLQAAVSATVAYVQGDLEMAASTQAAATAAPSGPGPVHGN